MRYNIETPYYEYVKVVKSLETGELNLYARETTTRDWYSLIGNYRTDAQVYAAIEETPILKDVRAIRACYGWIPTR
jgi:hypothetical protein